MKTLCRPVFAVLAGLALTGLAGCTPGGSAGGGSESPPPQPGAALASLDPCTILKPEQATAAGYAEVGKPVKQVDEEPGCSYTQRLVKRVTVFRNATKSLDQYGSQGNWGEFTKMDVNGRPGAKAITQGAVDQGICGTMMSAGGGVVYVEAQNSDSRKPFDACGESLKVAQQIEPSLPK